MIIILFKYWEKDIAYHLTCEVSNSLILYTVITQEGLLHPPLSRYTSQV